MLAYIIRRILLGIPTILGVLFILFVLFFGITTPELIARRVLGDKAQAEQIAIWIEQHGYDLPKFYNAEASGADRVLRTQIVQYYRSMLSFEFGVSDLDDVSIGSKIRKGVGPSLALTVPIFLVGLVIAIATALGVAMFRGTYVDHSVLVLCVIGMSIVYFLYIIGGQFLLGRILRWFPISGWSSRHMIHFLTLPWVVGILAGLGHNIRFYRTIMVNEINSDYMRTARAKGLGETRMLFVHLLKNAMIPILTAVVMAIPFLFTGNLLLEAFFGIPGLGGLTVEAIKNNDFSTISAMVYISSLMYIIANLLTDISYTLVDPRVRLQ